jgi:hypothetical protein
MGCPECYLLDDLFFYVIMNIMKKIIVFLTTAFIICSCSCSSTSTPKEQPFTVDLKSPRYSVGSAEAYFDRYLSIGSPRKGDITVYYYPLEDAVCLNFKIFQFVNCHQFWNKTGREAFVSAFERYKEEYETRKLIMKNNKKTREMYGTVQGYFMWKKTPVAVQAHGSPKVKLGYQFDGNAAFFTTTQMESYYEGPIGRSRNETSPATVVYFTRAQAESLVEMFNQEYLDGLKLPKGASGSDTRVDDYQEED